MPVSARQPAPRKFEVRALLPLATALVWLFASEGWSWWIWALLPAGYLVTAAVAALTHIHDVRVPQLQAAGAVWGVLLAIPAALSGHLGAALVAGLLSAWSFVGAGRQALAGSLRWEGAPEPDASAGVAAKAAIDEALLAYFIGTADIPAGGQVEAMCREGQRMRQLLRSEGWLRDPAQFHARPPAPTAVIANTATAGGLSFERLSFASDYRPHPELPRAADWLAHDDNARMQLRVFRHPGAPRPWILCIHGYRMGWDWMDFGLFDPGWLHKKLGLNVLMPVLPMHGPRKRGRRSGDGFFDGDLLDLVHAEAQAAWDLRRSLAWLRDREPGAQVGVYGVSLGGYNAALLAALDPDLAFVIAAIPLTDVASTLWRHLPGQHARYYAQHGFDEAGYRELLTPISPLAMPAKLPVERLHILAGSADRVIWPDQPLRLAQHWGAPVQWYAGSHLTIRREPLTRRVVENAVRSAGWR